MAAVFNVRIEPTADASLAAMRERSKFGIAMAAMIKMIATTISNSINEKPFCFLFIFSPRSTAPNLYWYSLPGYLLLMMQGGDHSRVLVNRFNTSSYLVNLQ